MSTVTVCVDLLHRTTTGQLFFLGPECSSGPGKTDPWSLHGSLIPDSVRTWDQWCLLRYRKQKYSRVSTTTDPRSIGLEVNARSCEQQIWNQLKKIKKISSQLASKRASFIFFIQGGWARRSQADHYMLCQSLFTRIAKINLKNKLTAGRCSGTYGKL